MAQKTSLSSFWDSIANRIYQAMKKKEVFWAEAYEGNI